MLKNILYVLLFIILILIICIINLYETSNFCFNKEDIYGYYEANPAFLEKAGIKDMSLLITNECKLMIEEEDNEDIEEYIFSLDYRNIKKCGNIVSCVCKSESDIDHPITNNIIDIIYNTITGELNIYEKNNNTILASLVKDNIISLYL